MILAIVYYAIGCAYAHQDLCNVCNEFKDYREKKQESILSYGEKENSSPTFETTSLLFLLSSNIGWNAFNSVWWSILIKNICVEIPSSPQLPNHICSKKMKNFYKMFCRCCLVFPFNLSAKMRELLVGIAKCIIIDVFLIRSIGNTKHSFYATFKLHRRRNQFWFHIRSKQ